MTRADRVLHEQAQRLDSMLSQLDQLRLLVNSVTRISTGSDVDQSSTVQCLDDIDDDIAAAEIKINAALLSLGAMMDAPAG